MENIRRSETVISAILVFLMDKGIQSADLDASSIDLTEEEKPFFQDCCQWLLDEGIIRARQQVETFGGGFAAFDVQITSKGFEALGHQISFGGTTSSIGDAVQKISQDRTSHTMVGDFVGGILGGFTKSMGS